jgi:capsular polysaccharide biosynthesis protein
MVEAIDSRPIAEETTRQLGLHATPQALLSRLTVEQIQDTQFIQLYFEDPNPKRAQSVVNTICQVSSERISQEVGANNATAKVWETATLPNAPVSPHPVRNGLVALGLGLMIGLGLVFMLEHLSNSWRSPEEVERILGVPALGIIPAFEAAKSKQRRAKDRMIKSGASTKPRL